MKVLMLPHLADFKDPGSESGIRRVIEAYFKYLPQFGVELVDKGSDYDVLAVHAGCIDDYRADEPMVAITHGLYWTGSYDAPKWEYATNAHVIKSIRYAREVTVPSPWVAEAFQRDMHFSPHIIPHGIDWQAWQHNYQPGDYVLWNKNRTGDVCDIDPVSALATKFPGIKFVSTFRGGIPLPNIEVTGIIPHVEMKALVQQCGIYLSTTEETFGIGVLEAMAAGRPVLGYRHGGNVDLVEHGVNGYLAVPNDIDDLVEGFLYCIDNREVLGRNSAVMARQWTWESSCEKLARVFEKALIVEPPTAAIIIPTYNYGGLIGTAIKSALGQTYDQLTDVIVVDDGSEEGDPAEHVVMTIKEEAEKNLADAQAVVDDISNELDTLDKAIGEEEDEDQLSALRWNAPHVRQKLAEAMAELERAQGISNRAAILKYIRQSNAGVAIARNNGISMTDAKYISCLDADDRIAPTFLEALIPPMEADQSLGLTYAGLLILAPKGDTIIELKSKWPHDCNFDEQVEGKNQVPTCCVFRRRAWERLGGYRQRYAPRGCGTEDAEFWLRIGAAGWDIRQVTTDRLFHYLLGGRTSGDKEYREVNYLQWHPWTVDTYHPFASIATPFQMSHKVRQYNKPAVSVVIPVGPGHEKDIVDALDSLEAQLYRGWEAIVVDDTGDNKLDLTAFPFARLVKTPGKKGAGYARNRGAEIARGQFLLFLDADDWLYPDAIWRMLEEYSAYGDEVAVYGDSNGLVIISEEYAKQMHAEHRLMEYHPQDGHALIRFFNPEYDCVLACRQPDKNGDFYLWCYISTMVPRHWHDEIGGFDEDMESWEDWDYFLRLARAGKCFAHISEPLLVYRFYSGNRRWKAHPDHEEGLQLAWNLVQYMTDKYGGMPMAGGCTGCGGSRRRSVHDYASRTSRQLTADQIASGRMDDSDFVLCEYLGIPTGNISEHSVIGVTVFDAMIPGVPMIARDGGFSIDYRYKKAGDKFLVHREDLERAPNWFRPTELDKRDFQSAMPKIGPPPAPPEPQPLAEALDQGIKEASTPEEMQDAAHKLGGHLAPPKAIVVPEIVPETAAVEGAQPEQPELVEMPVPVTEKGTLTKSDLQSLPGISGDIADQMLADGITTLQGVLDKGYNGLKTYRGVADVRAQLIIEGVTMKLSEADASAIAETQA